MRQHFALTRSQQRPAGKFERKSTAVVIAFRKGGNRIADTLDNKTRIERSDHVVMKADLDRIDCISDVTVGGYDEVRRRKLRSVDRSQHGEAGLTRYVQIEQHTDRRTNACGGDERFAFGKGDDAVIRKREHHRQCIARGSIIIDDEEITRLRGGRSHWRVVLRSSVIWRFVFAQRIALSQNALSFNGLLCHWVAHHYPDGKPLEKQMNAAGS
jgi:hypothetical protein